MKEQLAKMNAKTEEQRREIKKKKYSPDKNRITARQINSRCLDKSRRAEDRVVGRGMAVDADQKQAGPGQSAMLGGHGGNQPETR